MSITCKLKQLEPDILSLLKKNPDKIDLLIKNFGEEVVSLDKAWHGIHYLLTETAWGVESIEAKAILGGKEIGNDLGYGSARYLEPVEVWEIAEKLKKIDVFDLEKRYDVEKFVEANIYGVSEESDMESLRYFMEYYEDMLGYYIEAAQEGNGMLIYMV